MNKVLDWVKNHLIASIVIVCVLLAAIIIGIVVGVHNKNSKSNSNTDGPSVPMDTAVIIPKPEDIQDLNPELAGNISFHDFSALKDSMNEDIYAWITVPNTCVDYPILQSEQDNFYLTENYNLDHQTYPGCIYTNAGSTSGVHGNAKDFTDYITLIYGHDMRADHWKDPVYFEAGDTMFHTLHNFDKQDFFDSNEVFSIETEDKIYELTIPCVVNYTDDNILYYYDPTSKEDRDKFWESLKTEARDDVSHFRDYELKEDDRLVALSVCFETQKDRRFLVIGVITNEIDRSSVGSAN